MGVSVTEQRGMAARELDELLAVEDVYIRVENDRAKRQADEAERRA